MISTIPSNLGVLFCGCITWWPAVRKVCIQRRSKGHRTICSEMKWNRRVSRECVELLNPLHHWDKTQPDPGIQSEYWGSAGHHSGSPWTLPSGQGEVYLAIARHSQHSAQDWEADIEVEHSGQRTRISEFLSKSPSPAFTCVTKTLRGWWHLHSILLWLNVKTHMKGLRKFTECFIHGK